ncbi:MAG: aldo/keto reductase [Dehalococcoidales bacterium]
MQYRKFGRLDWQVSALGFGLENLPADDDAAVKMLRYAIDVGVNFIDVGSPLVFKDNQRLAQLLHKALGDGYRQKIKIAAALPSVNINAASDFDQQLEELLKWLHEDSVDFLTLGGLNRFSWPKLKEIDITRRIDKAIANKKIGHIGFFFHDQYQFLREIIEDYDNWTFCQFQYSFMDIDHHPGASGLTYAADNGLAVVVSKPLLGGRLTKAIPASVAKIWSESSPKRSPAEWGLRWVWNHGEVATAICDMSSLEQVKENITLADIAKAGSFTVPEELVISRARDAYRERKPLQCTACRGCMPCPLGIDAPRIFEIYNDAVMYNDTAKARDIYRLEHHNIDACNECGLCAGKCGLKFSIPEWLKKARELLVKDK